jgi:hypothetical protein
MDSLSLRWRWGTLTRSHRRWLLYNAVLVTGFINLAVNAAIAWLSSRGHHQIPLWSIPLLGKPSVAIDTVGTFFFLPLMTCLMCTTAVWQQVRTGRLPELRWDQASPSALDRLPPARLRRGLVLGVVCTIVLAPASIVLLTLIDTEGMRQGQFVLYKGVLGVVLGAIVTPLVAGLAMADEVVPRRQHT